MLQIEKHIFKKCKQTNKQRKFKLTLTSCFYYPQPAIGLKLRLWGSDNSEMHWHEENFIWLTDPITESRNHANGPPYGKVKWCACLVYWLKKNKGKYNNGYLGNIIFSRFCITFRCKWMHFQPDLCSECVCRDTGEKLKYFQINSLVFFLTG